FKKQSGLPYQTENVINTTASPKPKKTSKKTTKKTNVPDYYKPDYKNMTTDDEKAELEKKKAEMIARLENVGNEDKEDETEEFNRLKKESDELLKEFYGEDKKSMAE
ncbi:hypothetical protein QM864_09730, partial [Streptococcus australis]